jgi:hypothetical protein
MHQKQEELLIWCRKEEAELAMSDAAVDFYTPNWKVVPAPNSLSLSDVVRNSKFGTLSKYAELYTHEPQFV